MHFFTAFVVAATALGAVASPNWKTSTTSVKAAATTTTSAKSTSTAGSQTCSNSQQQYCCISTGAFELLDVNLFCILQSVLGTTCTAQQNCCQNSGSGGTVTCTNSAGNVNLAIPISVSVPITL